MRTAIILLLLFKPSFLQAEIPLTFGPRAHMDLRMQDKGVANVTLQKGNPHVWSSVPPKTYDPAKQTILAFEYFAPTGIGVRSIR